MGSFNHAWVKPAQPASLLGKARECCFRLAGAFALKSSRVEATCGARRERRDRSVARNRRRRRRGGALFELDGWDVAERFVEPVVVEPADALDDGELELAAVAPDAVGDQLGLEGVHEGLGERVVVGVADAADRREHAVIEVSVRPSLAHYGGDEFLCGLLDLNKAAAAARFVLVKADLAATQHASVTTGLAEVEADEVLEEVIARADEALYRERLRAAGGPDA